MITMPGIAWEAIGDLIDDPPRPDEIKLKGRGQFVVWDDPSPERINRITAAAEDALLWSQEWPNSKHKQHARRALKEWLGLV